MIFWYSFIPFRFSVVQDRAKKLPRLRVHWDLNLRIQLLLLQLQLSPCLRRQLVHQLSLRILPQLRHRLLQLQLQLQRRRHRLRFLVVIRGPEEIRQHHRHHHRDRQGLLLPHLTIQ